MTKQEFNKLILKLLREKQNKGYDLYELIKELEELAKDKGKVDN